MSLFNPNERELSEIIPQVESKVFEPQPGASFWVGKVAAHGAITMPDEYNASLQLRANVYIDERGWLSDEARDDQGCEVDCDDSRSVHFTVLEKNGSPEPHVVGTSRLIVKRAFDDKLPVEKIFPDVFDENPIEIGAVEGSRLIARHPDQITQHLIGLANIRAMDLWSLSKDIPHIYGMAERHLLRYLQLNGFPYEQLSPYRQIEEYGGTLNAVIRFNPRKVAAADPSSNSRRRAFKRFFEEALETNGQGYFNEELETISSELDNG